MIATSEDPDTMLHGRLGYGEGMETVGAAQGRGQCCVRVCVGTQEEEERWWLLLSGGWFLGSCLGGVCVGIGLVCMYYTEY